MKKTALGLRLLELRQSHDLTQKQLCEDLHIGRSTYSYFETGARLPDIETLIMIAQYYKISVDQLIGMSAPSDQTGAQTPSANDSDSDATPYLLHLRAKHIPPEFILDLTKPDYDFFKEYLRLSPENKAELQYLTQYKLKKQTPES